ncbi:uncharacterized protein BXZ73DRAFT_76289 [Epithele typhae]|uniref:uncharacterized protein n=1 Tax=Epithele typhae TaxID=378194 RepID=UPI0020077FE2|nr:uncharacterized protein BXZ73DRAFT_76289 [Epithele typhae]KAH9938777.1 hypothetical protein BXZ73DRAFT_76289 [Epithele typhae]
MPSIDSHAGVTQEDENVIDLTTEDSSNNALFSPELLLSDSDLKAHVPGPDLPVQLFKQFILPKISASRVTAKVEVWFSPDPPNQPLKRLLQRDIPADVIRADLNQAAEKQLRDGRRSILLPGAQLEERYPPAALDLWRHLATAQDAKLRWEKTTKWLTDLAADRSLDPSVCTEAKTICATIVDLPWKGKMTVSGVRTWSLMLTRLLAMEPLCDDIIDMMMATLNQRAQARRGSKPPFIGTLAVMNEIVKFGNRQGDTYNMRNFRVLHRISDNVSSDPSLHLYFPSLVRKNHWIAFHVDFESGKIEYADSLSLNVQPPKSELSAVERWLKAVFPHWKFIRDRRDVATMEQTPQPDIISCGLYAARAVAHAVFGDSLLQPADLVRERLRWGSELLRQLPGQNPIASTVTADVEAAQAGALATVAPSSVASNVAVVTKAVAVDHPEAGRTKAVVNDLPCDATRPSEVDLPCDIARTSASPTASSGVAVTVVLATEETTTKNSISTQKRDTPTDAPPTTAVDVQATPVSSIGNALPLSASLYSIFSGGFRDTTAPTKGKKRAAISNVSEGIASKRQKTEGKAVGTSKSAIASRKARQQAAEGTYKWKANLLAVWKAKILEIDEYATIHKDNMNVTCSRCMSPTRIKEPYDASRFKAHCKTCHPLRTHRPVTLKATVVNRQVHLLP